MEKIKDFVVKKLCYSSLIDLNDPEDLALLRRDDSTTKLWLFSALMQEKDAKTSLIC